LFILHIDSGREMRGGQWQAWYLLRGLAQAGHRVRLLAPRNSPLYKAALELQIDVRPLGLGALISACEGVQLIHAHDARAHTLAILTSKPVIVSRRVAFPVGRGFASRWKYRRARHFIAVSKHVAEGLVEAGVDRERITVVYDGVPVGATPDFGTRKGLVTLDSDDPGKGKKVVIDAAALAGIPVHFTRNPVSDLADAGVFVYITELEGLGSAALLAMAAGTPVVASRVGGLPEIVKDGVTGLLTSNDPHDVADAMRRVLGDPELARRLASQARAMVEREFSVDQMVEQTLRVYERVLT